MKFMKLANEKLVSSTALNCNLMNWKEREPIFLQMCTKIERKNLNS